MYFLIYLFIYFFKFSTDNKKFCEEHLQPSHSMLTYKSGM